MNHGAAEPPSSLKTNLDDQKWLTCYWVLAWLITGILTFLLIYLFKFVASYIIKNHIRPISDQPHETTTMDETRIDIHQLHPTKTLSQEKIMEIADSCLMCLICLDEFGITEEVDLAGLETNDDYHQDKLQTKSKADGRRQQPRILPMCGHKFHEDCIRIWLQRHPNCPTCRGSAAYSRLDSVV